MVVVDFCHKVETGSGTIHDNIILEILFYIIQYIIMFFLIMILHGAYVALIISILYKFNKCKLQNGWNSAVGV